MSKTSTLRKTIAELAHLRSMFLHNPAKVAELDKLIAALDKMSVPVKIAPRKIVAEIGKFERTVKAKTKYESGDSQPDNGFDVYRDYARALNSLQNVILKALN